MLSGLMRKSGSWGQEQHFSFPSNFKEVLEERLSPNSHWQVIRRLDVN